MKKIVSILFFIVLALPLILIAKPVSADIAMPSVTTYYFQKDGQPYKSPLEFSYDCYGYQSGPPDFAIKSPGTYTPEKLLSYPYDGKKISCSSYGCNVEGANGPYSAKYAHFDYCIFKISSLGEDFEVKQTSLDNNCIDVQARDDGIELTCSTTINIVNSTIAKDMDPQDVILDQKQNVLDYSDEIKNSPSLNPIPDGGRSGTTRLLTYEKLFLYAFLFTIIIETLVLFGLLKLIFKKKSAGIRSKDILFTGIIASAVTIPYLWFVLPDFVGGISYVVIGEISVVLIESLIIAWILRLKWPFALLLSFVCNLISFLLGLLLIKIIL